MTVTEPSSDALPHASRARAWWHGAPLAPPVHLGVGLLMPMALLAGGMMRARAYTADAAFVSFRYADNLAAGQGLVYNAGERVEGYSNFLWTLLLGLLSTLGADVESAAKVLGALSGCAALWALWLLARRLQPFGALPCVATWLAATSFVYGGYAVFGTEAPLLALLTLGGAERFAREVEAEDAGRQGVLPWSGVLLALACLTRMEALILFAALVVASGPRASTRAGLLRLAAFLGPVLAHQVFRLAYYGSLWPNVALATTGDARAQWRGGRAYLDNYQRHAGAVIWLALSAAAVAAVRLLRGLDGGAEERSAHGSTVATTDGTPATSAEPAVRSPEVWRASFALALCAWVVGYGLWLLAIGGDSAPWFRLVAPVEPFVYLLVDQVVRGLVERRERAIHLALLAFGLWVFGSRAKEFEDMFQNMSRGEKVSAEESAGRAVAWLRRAEPGPVAIADIGQVGYRTRLPIVDMLGVVEPTIARLRGGYTNKVGAGFTDAVFARRPRYVVIVSSERDCKSPSTPSSRAVYFDERFQPFQVRESLRLRGGGAWCIYGR